jgi:Putative DNA-binding domain
MLPERAHAAAFAAGLLNPDAATPDDARAWSGRDMQARYNVYRNNVTVSLIDALASIYPAVQRITGVEFFRAMARFHIRQTPPASPLLFEYGRDFPSFIEQYEYAQPMPWLADVARVERAWLDAYHAADLPVLTHEVFAHVDESALASMRFIVHPATRIVRSRYPAVAIFVMNRQDGPVTPLHSADAEDALVARPAEDVIVSRLPAGGAVFLSALAAGECLADAVAMAFDETASFDLQANLAGMIEAGVFTAIQTGA